MAKRMTEFVRAIAAYGSPLYEGCAELPSYSLQFRTAFSVGAYGYLKILLGQSSSTWMPPML